MRLDLLSTFPSVERNECIFANRVVHGTIPDRILRESGVPLA
jgi:hypothetical protein